jgi:AbrB family looped-hinge helix DNA binding protein
MRTRVTRITSKGQVVIPKQFRDRTGLQIGDSLRLESHEDDIRVSKRSGWAKATAGCLPSSLAPLEPATIDELAERIAVQEVRKKYGIAE